MNPTRPGRTAARTTSLLALLLLAACGTTTPSPGNDTLTVTPGASAPSRSALLRPLSAAAPQPDATATGTNTATVGMSGCAASTDTRTLTYRVTGKQEGTATVTFPTAYTYAGGAWVASGAQTVTVAARTAQAAATTFTVPVRLTVGAGDVTGTSSVSVNASKVENSNQQGSKLDAPGPATIAVNFTTCVTLPPEPEVLDNTAPVLTVPKDFTVEATGTTTPVDFAAQLSASDKEEGDLTGQIACTPGSSSGFGLGDTTVTCSVSDTGKRLRTDGSAGPDGEVLTTTASFKVTVVDTTPPALTLPGSAVNVAATGITGVTPDYSQWASATDLVDGAVTPLCTPATLPIGLSQAVTCTATDASGNAASGSFTVNVTFASAARSLLQPVNDTRNGLPLSLFKAGSTIPLKFLPPLYAGNVPATDLAAGLRLVVTTVPSTGSSVEEEATDLSSGSTVWRYDATSGQYVFNLSTRNAFFRAGTAYRADISYQGVPIASGEFRLK